MTLDEVQSLVQAQSKDKLALTNGHHITLGQVIISPRKIQLIFRAVAGGRMEDQALNGWLVGQENNGDGYKIVMREDGKQFGLASSGFAHDKHLILDGWYGTLVSAFLAM